MSHIPIFCDASGFGIRNISLVILDIIMPRMDGKECLEQLLRINPAVKVIISSGVGHYDLINDIVKIGAKGAVNKPYSMRQLLGMVREVLDGIERKRPDG